MKPFDKETYSVKLVKYNFKYLIINNNPSISTYFNAFTINIVACSCKIYRNSVQNAWMSVTWKGGYQLAVIPV